MVAFKYRNVTVFVKIFNFVSPEYISYTAFLATSRTPRKHVPYPQGVRRTPVEKRCAGRWSIGPMRSDAALGSAAFVSCPPPSARLFAHQSSSTGFRSWPGPGFSIERLPALLDRFLFSFYFSATKNIKEQRSNRWHRKKVADRSRTERNQNENGRRRGPIKGGERRRAEFRRPRFRRRPAIRGNGAHAPRSDLDGSSRET